MGSQRVVSLFRRLKHYLAELKTTCLGCWSGLMRSSILSTNLGAWPFTICRMPGPNSWKRLILASLPIVEPKSLNGAALERIQYGRDALWAATELSTPRKYEVFSLLIPESSRVIKMREACVSGPGEL